MAGAASPYQDPDTARLSVFLAPDAGKGVVLRRGPGTQTLMTAWDLSTDTFTDGQWLSSKVYSAHCDLSPCGQYFLYFTGRFRGHYYAFTAISPVPYFTAHILWPQDHTWGGGGLFDAARSAIRLNLRRDEAAKIQTGLSPTKRRKLPRYMRAPQKRAAALDYPPDFGALPGPYRSVEPLWEHAGAGEDDPIENIRMTRDGWTREQSLTGASVPRTHVPAPDDPSVRFYWKTDGALIWAKPSPSPANGAITARLIRDQHGEVNGRALVMGMTLTDGAGTVRDFQRVDWADFGPSGDLLYARNGALFRVAGNALMEAEPRKLMDLNDRKFASVLPPEPLRAASTQPAARPETPAKPSRKPWDPLDQG